MSLLRISNLAGGYGDTNILRDFSGAVEAGSVTGVFGRNGVGKTTLARLIAGELKPAGGRLELNEQSIEHLAAYQRSRLGIAYLPQTSMVFDNLTVRENLELVPQALELEQYLRRFPRIAERLEQMAGVLSGGERKLLGFVRAMVEPSVLLVLDEPSEGVQAENIELMQQCITEKRAQGVGIILIEQNLNMLKQSCDHLWGIESGHLRYSTPITAADPQTITAILSV